MIRRIGVVFNRHFPADSEVEPGVPRYIGMEEAISDFVRMQTAFGGGLVEFESLYRIPDHLPGADRLRYAMTIPGQYVVGNLEAFDDKTVAVSIYADHPLLEDIDIVHLPETHEICFGIIKSNTTNHGTVWVRQVIRCSIERRHVFA